MKKYNLNINGNTYNVHIKEAENNCIKMEVNGTAYEVELEQEVKTTKTPRLVRAEPKQNTNVGALKTDKSIKKIIAPLPGTVLTLCVKEGDTIKTGDDLIVLEAMKMENTIQAESSGVVKTILVQNGSNVLQGDVLLEIG